MYIKHHAIGISCNIKKKDRKLSCMLEPSIEADSFKMVNVIFEHEIKHSCVRLIMLLSKGETWRICTEMSFKEQMLYLQ